MKHSIYMVFLVLMSFILIFLSERPFQFALIFWALLIAISYSDFKTFRIPNLLTITIFLTGIAFHIYFEQNLWLATYSLIIATVIFSLIAIVYYKVRGVHGLGIGDIKLFAAGAIWLNPVHLPFVLLISSVTALLYIIIFKTDVNTKMRIAYGPFLCIGIWITWLFGHQMMAILT